MQDFWCEQKYNVIITSLGTSQRTLPISMRMYNTVIQSRVLLKMTRRQTMNRLWRPSQRLQMRSPLYSLSIATRAQRCPKHPEKFGFLIPCSVELLYRNGSRSKNSWLASSSAGVSVKAGARMISPSVA